VDVKHLDGAGELSFDPAGGLRVGAGVNLNRLIASPEVNRYYPILAEAAQSVASYQLRTRATIVGNICNASPAGDTIGACLVLDVSLEIHGVDGPRLQPLSTFFKGPRVTVLRPGDVVRSVRFPLPPQGCAGRYFKLGRNRLSDLAIVGVTALGYPDPAAASGFRFRLALASVAPVPLVPAEAEAVLAEKPINIDLLQQASRLAQQACHPIDDVRGSARYRSAMARNLTFQALAAVWENLH
jgi:carbon-monoxide dehydrogenase medium subunit